MRKRLIHPFGTIKHGMNQGAFLMRRLGCVRGEFSLTALVYNIRRPITLVGVPVLIAAAVLLGVLLATITGWAVLDPALAALVALNILWSGWQLMRESVGGLMDIAVPDELLARIRKIISANADEALEAHDLRTRQAG